VAGADLDPGHPALKPAGPAPKRRAVVLLELLADGPGGHVTHLVGQGGAQT